VKTAHLTPAGPRYHHYVFELFALSAMLDLPADATRAQLFDAMKDVTVGKRPRMWADSVNNPSSGASFRWRLGKGGLWLSLRFRSRNTALGSKSPSGSTAQQCATARVWTRDVTTGV
jgi:hypothetical protein